MVIQGTAIHALGGSADRGAVNSDLRNLRNLHRGGGIEFRLDDEQGVSNDTRQPYMQRSEQGLRDIREPRDLSREQVCGVLRSQCLSQAT